LNRLPGVTFTAVLLIIAGSFSALFAVVSIVGLLFFRFSMPSDLPRDFLILIPVVFDLVWAGCAAWSIASGVGLLRLRSWARVSVFVFAGLMLFVALPGLLVMPIMMSNFMSHDEFGGGFRIFAIGFMVFYALQIVLAVWWLYYFNTRKVKDLFRSRGFPIAPPPPQPPAIFPVPPDALPKSKRPVSISVIAAIMLISAGFAPFSLVMLKSMKVPMPVMGFWIEGWPVAFVILFYLIVQVITGVGLLKMKPWARTVSICYFVFGMINSLVTFLLPGSAAHFEKMIAGMMPKFPSSDSFPPDANSIISSIPHMASSMIWVGVIFGLLFAGVQLWFVVKEKQAFIDASQSKLNVS
jgi:hypothetical protein